jgi:hypothetical protein
MKGNSRVRACSTHGIYEKYLQTPVGKPENKRQLGIPKRTFWDNIKIDLKGRMYWIKLALDRNRRRGGTLRQHGAETSGSIKEEFLTSAVLKLGHFGQ